MLLDVLRGCVQLAAGMSGLTRERAVGAGAELLGGAKAGAERLVAGLLGLADPADVEYLAQRVEILERRLAQNRSERTGAGGEGTAQQ